MSCKLLIYVNPKTDYMPQSCFFASCSCLIRVCAQQISSCFVCVCVFYPKIEKKLLIISPRLVPAFY